MITLVLGCLVQKPIAANMVSLDALPQPLVIVGVSVVVLTLIELFGVWMNSNGNFRRLVGDIDRMQAELDKLTGPGAGNKKREKTLETQVRPKDEVDGCWGARGASGVHGGGARDEEAWTRTQKGFRSADGAVSFPVARFNVLLGKRMSYMSNSQLQVMHGHGQVRESRMRVRGWQVCSCRQLPWGAARGCMGCTDAASVGHQERMPMVRGGGARRVSWLVLSCGHAWGTKRATMT